MCLIVVKNKAEASFSVADFRSSFTRNNDGTGIMYIENGRIVVEKTAAFGIKEHLEMYYKHMNKSQFVLHHRFATHGEKTELNVHPFKVLSIDDGDPVDLYMAHNGVISMNKFSSNADKKYSDTHLFVIEYLRPILKKYPTLIEDDVFHTLLNDFIGHGNKLAFLRNDGFSLIFNKSAGTEQNGCWLSNSYSVQSNVTNVHNFGKTHGTRGWADAYAGDDADLYGEDGWWRDDWRTANARKAKAENSLSGLDVNELFVSINEYAGMPETAFVELFNENPHLVFDMINLLEPEGAKEEILNYVPSIVAGQLYTLLQTYSKKKAA